jgi:hypothetical protein
MPVAIERTVLDLAHRIDELGREGHGQEQIAQALGYRDKWQLRRELKEMGLALAAENRVRVVLTGERLEDMERRGSIVAADAQAGAVPA